MTPQEREVITGIFERLRNAANQPRDPEAERLIGDLIRQQPYAPYALAQSVYVQEQALMNLQAQVEELQAELEQQRSQPQGGGGFLSGLFGGGQRQPERPAMNPMQRGGMPMQRGMPLQPMQPGQGGPWGQAGQQRGGMGFLGTAAMTAAGVAGGMLVGNALMNAFSGSGGAQAAEAAGIMPMDQANAAAPADQGYDAQNASDDGGYDSFDGGDSFDV